MGKSDWISIIYQAAEKTLLGNTADPGTEDQGGLENGGKNNLTSKKDEEGWQAVGLR